MSNKKRKQISNLSDSQQKNRRKKNQNESIWELLKDLVTDPFEYSHGSSGLSKLLGGICLLAALCLLFYLTGHM